MGIRLLRHCFCAWKGRPEDETKADAPQTLHAISTIQVMIDLDRRCCPAEGVIVSTEEASLIVVRNNIFGTFYAECLNSETYIPPQSFKLADVILTLRRIRHWLARNGWRASEVGGKSEYDTEDGTMANGKALSTLVLKSVMNTRVGLNYWHYYLCMFLPPPS